MTVESPNKQILTDFLLEVSQAITFQELAKAYKKISKDFDILKEKDNQEKLTVFIERYDDLSKKAQQLLNKESNGEEPTEDQIAIFGEMIILRDFCYRRLHII